MHYKYARARVVVCARMCTHGCAHTGVHVRMCTNACVCMPFGGGRGLAWKLLWVALEVVGGCLGGGVRLLYVWLGLAWRELEVRLEVVGACSLSVQSIVCIIKYYLLYSNLNLI